MAKGVYVGAPNFEPVALPSGYTQLEYIQSSGTQYIDTNFKPDGETTVNIAFQTSSVPDNLNDTLPVYGTATDYNSNAFEFWTLSGGFATYGSQDYKSNLGITIGKKHTVSQAKNVLTVDGTSYTFTKQTFTAPYSLLLFATHRSGGIKICASAANLKIYSCEIYNNGTLVRNFVPVKNSSGTIGLYDLVNSAFYTNAGSGTFTAGATYAEVARKVKKIYLGLNNIAHKILKGYIGDENGIARLFFSNVGKIIKYTGSITNLSRAARDFAAASNANYALFGGGLINTSCRNTVDAYNASLTHSNPTNLSAARAELAAATAGNYVLFAGGRTEYYYGSSVDALFNNVDAYNISLTRSTPTALSAARHKLSGATIGNYALFAGGYDYTNPSRSDSSINMYSTVDAYNQSLTRSTASSMQNGRADMASTTLGNYALFAGGRYLTKSNSSATIYYRNQVDAYSASLTRTTAPKLSTGRHGLAAAVAGDYALFAGGKINNNSGSVSSAVDAYNKSLTRSTITSLSKSCMNLGAAFIGSFAIFAGGETENSKTFSSVDIYDSSLTRTTGTSLSANRRSLASATIGNYALFAGGCQYYTNYGTSSSANNLNAYTITYD